MSSSPHDYLRVARYFDSLSRAFLPEVGGTTGFGMPFNVCGNCPAANAVIGLMYVPCAVAAAMSAACCYNVKRISMSEKRFARIVYDIILLYYYFREKETHNLLRNTREIRAISFVGKNFYPNIRNKKKRNILLYV